MRCIRVWFKKIGLLRFVSHLDTMRCMTRAVRRADIPLWYTEGFNPHPYLNFPAPMPLGVEGVREPMDMRIEGEISDGEIIERLNAQLPPGFRIIEIAEPIHKTNELAFAKYIIKADDEPGLYDKIAEAMSSGELKCEKPGKQRGRKTMKTVDISAGLSDYSINKENNEIILDVTLPCSNESNINPINLMSAVKAYTNVNILPVSMIRYGLLISDKSDFR